MIIISHHQVVLFIIIEYFKHQNELQDINIAKIVNLIARCVSNSKSNFQAEFTKFHSNPIINSTNNSTKGIKSVKLLSRIRSSFYKNPKKLDADIKSEIIRRKTGSNNRKLLKLTGGDCHHWAKLNLCGRGQS
ncbi:hypothetical protein Glove_372g81 [Diversispora epigaea]|uniref:Uncharacterized protein n=1 Tax=Diversispora epigaea TaxID=1348612 RepID=A0A397HAH7_9GLOM|nr:hypothetical protein Glove_372g81 [Diversispora epigaea]